MRHARQTAPRLGRGLLLPAVLLLSLPAQGGLPEWQALLQTPAIPVGQDPPAAREVAPAANREAAIKERDELFMLASMAYVWTRLHVKPKPGYDIAAIVAWDVDDLSKTPRFVIERNRNLQKQSNLKHAEVMATEAATMRQKDHASATLYTTLEPCPMCAPNIAMARIPKTYYCMQDPSLRDLKTGRSTAQAATAFASRSLKVEPSALALCAGADKAMWGLIAGDPQAYRKTYPNGDVRFKATDYLTDKAAEIFKPAYQALRSAQVRHRENVGLLDALRQAVGEPLSCDSLAQAAALGEFTRKDIPLEDAREPRILPRAALARREEHLAAVKALSELRPSGPHERLDIDDALQALAASYRRDMRLILGLADPPDDVLRAENQALNGLAGGARRVEAQTLTHDEYMALISRLTAVERDTFLALPAQDQGAFLYRLAVQKGLAPANRASAPAEPRKNPLEPSPHDVAPKKGQLETELLGAPLTFVYQVTEDAKRGVLNDAALFLGAHRERFANALEKGEDYTPLKAADSYALLTGASAGAQVVFNAMRAAYYKDPSANLLFRRDIVLHRDRRPTELKGEYFGIPGSHIYAVHLPVLEGLWENGGYLLLAHPSVYRLGASWAVGHKATMTWHMDRRFSPDLSAVLKGSEAAKLEGARLTLVFPTLSQYDKRR